MRLLGIITVLLALVCFGTVASAQVTVDGDLSDIMAVAQGDQGDPVNEICLLSKSGFDLRWVYVYYNVAEDRLYLGLDLMDVPMDGGVGINGPGVPGDADGNLDPHTASEPSCPVEEEQNGVGPDEMYLVKVDTNANGLFNEFEDIRIIYRGDSLRFEHGDSTPIGTATGTAVLGTAGAPVDPLLPNQNRLTEDIEIAVDNWSSLDPVPTCFIVTTFSGSLVDGFPEDELITPINVQVADPEVNLLKEVRNVTAGGAFGKSASVEIGDTVEFRLTLDNIGNVDLAPAAIVDLLPFELTFVPGSVVGADIVKIDPDPNGVLYSFRQLSGTNVLPTGATRVVTFQATVEPTINGSVVNSADGGGFPPGECAEPEVIDSDIATVSVVDIECTKEVSLDGVNFFSSVDAAPGQTVWFRVTLENPSDSDLTDATIVDTVPAGLINIVAPGCNIAGQVVTCNIGALPAQSSVAMIIQAEVDPSASGTLVNVADCTATFGTDTLMTTCEAELDILAPDMVCDKDVSYDGVAWTDNLDVITGMEVFFRVQVTNTGDAPLFMVTVEDTLPAGFGSIQIVSGASCGVAGQMVSCSNVGPLDPAQTATVIYKAVVTAASGTLTNTAMCVGTSGTAGNPGEEIETQCDASVDLLEPCVVCVKEVSLDGVTYGGDTNADPGDHVWFRVTVTNCGTAPLENVTLVDDLPAGLINASTADANCGVAGNTITCNLASLAAGASQEFFFEADIAPNAAGTLVNTMVITATPTVNGNAGSDVTTDCSVTLDVGPLEIPTLSEWGMILLCSLLALSLILHHRFRLPGA